ncbi:MAG: glycoside hydrolase family 9 protein, partial [Fibrobacterota bacterium]
GTFKNTGKSNKAQMKITASSSSLLVRSGDTLYTLTSEARSGTVYEGEIPSLPDGRYRIVAGADTSAPFIIGPTVYNMIKDALLNFYGVNRCGDSKSWFHKPCHLQDAVTGGWHDCGDHLKEGATMSYAAAVLGLASAAFSNVDQDHYDADQSKTRITDGIPDILYEAKHGADFILRSYDLAGGDVSKMITSVGGFGNAGYGDDHSYWGPPEIQDLMPPSRGGPPRCPRSEPTTDYLGKYAANLAFVSKGMQKYDAQYSDKCLAAARAIYSFASTKLNSTSTPAYSGATSVNDDIAFGCLALLWATGERKYLDDLCFDKTLGPKAHAEFPKLFQGGWFTNNDPIFSHSSANTHWASTYTHVLWGFYR